MISFPWSLTTKIEVCDKSQTIRDLLDGAQTEQDGQTYQIIGIDNLRIFLLADKDFFSVRQIIRNANIDHEIVHDYTGAYTVLQYPETILLNGISGDSGLVLAIGSAIAIFQGVVIAKPSLLASGGSLLMGKPV